jgi:hypothetical protein
MSRRKLFIIFTAIAGVLAGCADQYNIQRLRTSADIYLGQQIEVQGKVLETKRIADNPLESFKLTDQSGDIWIVTHKDAPLRGSYVQVTGILKNGSDTDWGTQLGEYVIEEYERTLFAIEIGDDGNEYPVPATSY